MFLAVVGLHCGAGLSPAARRGAAVWLWGEALSPRWIAVLSLWPSAGFGSRAPGLARGLGTCGSRLSGTEEWPQALSAEACVV